MPIKNQIFCMSDTVLDKEAMSVEEAAVPEPRTSFRAPSAQRPSGKRGFSWKKLLLIVLLAAGAVWGARLLQYKLAHAETDDAFLTSNVHLVNAHVAGTVSEVLVEPNHEVRAGQVLFRL